jgi:hypothetical protein
LIHSPAQHIHSRGKAEISPSRVDLVVKADVGGDWVHRAKEGE